MIDALLLASLGVIQSSELIIWVPWLVPRWFKLISPRSRKVRLAMKRLLLNLNFAKKCRKLGKNLKKKMANLDPKSNTVRSVMMNHVLSTNQLSIIQLIQTTCITLYVPSALRQLWKLIDQHLALFAVNQDMASDFTIAINCLILYTLVIKKLLAQRG